MKKAKILFLDDEERFLLKLNQSYKNLVRKDIEFIFFSNVQKLLDQKEAIKNADAIVADLRLDGSISGLDFLELIRTQNLKVRLILITGQLITEKEQMRCKKINADFLFKVYGTDILIQNIIHFSIDQTNTNKIQHVFISYRTIDYKKGVSRLVKALAKNGLSVWIDRENILPGQDWQIAIKKAIENGMIFLACFSDNYWKSTINYMNEELQLAIDQLRKMPDDQIWFIPVKLEDCEIPYFEIRPNKTIASKQFVNLFENWNKGIDKIINIIKSN